MTKAEKNVTVGVLALQGAFSEHIYLLRDAFDTIERSGNNPVHWESREVRTAQDLAACDALIIPGGESTTMSLVASRSGLLEPLRSFVKVERKPTWGTCAGLILLAEAANRTRKGGQELIGGIDVRVNRNHFGRQTESFETPLELPFLREEATETVEGSLDKPFNAVFIRAPVIEKILPQKEGVQDEEEQKPDSVVAPSRTAKKNAPFSTPCAQVKIMATLPGRSTMTEAPASVRSSCEGDIVAARQGNVFGTSFHPELTNDSRIHVWWLGQIKAVIASEASDQEKQKD